MNEMSAVVGGQDLLLMCDPVHGLPKLGWARHSTILMQRTTRLPCAMSEKDDEVAARNGDALACSKSIGVPKLDEMAWAQTLKELEAGPLLGRFASVDEHPPGRVRLSSASRYCSAMAAQLNTPVGICMLAKSAVTTTCLRLLRVTAQPILTLRRLWCGL